MRRTFLAACLVVLAAFTAAGCATRPLLLPLPPP